MNGTFYPENDYRNYLEHHGILGMKWGVRRFQNKDGSYTSAGKQRYGNGRSGAKEEAGSGRSGGKDLDNSKNKVSGLGFSKQYKNDDEFRKDVLKKNPFAAIANVDAAKWVGEHKKEILIGS